MTSMEIDKFYEQAGAELCQAQSSLQLNLASCKLNFRLLGTYNTTIPGGWVGVRGVGDGWSRKLVGKYFGLDKMFI